jgi:hypothetical protein
LGGVADGRLLRSARSAERGGSCLLGARGFPIAAAHPLLLSVVLFHKSRSLSKLLMSGFFSLLLVDFYISRLSLVFFSVSGGRDISHPHEQRKQQATTQWRKSKKNGKRVYNTA